MIHSTARVEHGARIGANVRVWDHTIIRTGVEIGDNCIIGANVYIGCGVKIGNNCKIQNGACIYSAIIHDGVFIGPGVVFTNDRHPRAVLPDFKPKSFLDWEEESTTVKCGASIGANSTIVCGIEIGEWAAVGAGAVVTKSVPDYHLVVGVPARFVRTVTKEWS